MVVHLKKIGWEKTLCGLSGDYESTSCDENVTCENCKVSMRTAKMASAWIHTRSILRVFYVQRAGFGVVEGSKLLKSQPDQWTKKQQTMIKRQLASNPVLARLMNEPCKAIERGGSGDNRSSVSWEWQLKQLQDAGRCCPHCGGMI